MASLQIPLTNPLSSGANPLMPVGLRATVSDNSGRSVREASRDLEATFLSLLIKQMRATLDPEEGLFPGDPGDVQGGLFDLFMSKHLADGGGLGLAEYVEAMMSLPNAKPADTDGTPRSHGTASPGGSVSGIPGS